MQEERDALGQALAKLQDNKSPDADAAPHKIRGGDGEDLWRRFDRLFTDLMVSAEHSPQSGLLVLKKAEEIICEEQQTPLNSHKIALKILRAVWEQQRRLSLLSTSDKAQKCLYRHCPQHPQSLFSPQTWWRILTKQASVYNISMIDDEHDASHDTINKVFQED